MSDPTKDQRVRVITGHYGSGKTEFAIQYALTLSEAGKSVVLADLDVVNVYFRSREKTDMLAKVGIEVIGASEKSETLDVPAISARVFAPLQDVSKDLVMDIGGNPAGTRAIGQFRKQIEAIGCDHFFVINANRPETKDTEQVVSFLRQTEDISGFPVTGLINATHMLKATTVEDVLRGQELCESVSAETGIPVRYISCLETVAAQLPSELAKLALPLKLIMREGWML